MQQKNSFGDANRTVSTSVAELRTASVFYLNYRNNKKGLNSAPFIATITRFTFLTVPLNVTLNPIF